MPTNGRTDVLITGLDGGSPGVRNKMLGLAESIREAGYSTSVELSPHSGRQGLTDIRNAIKKTPTRLLWLRHLRSLPALTPLLTRLRTTGTKVVLEVPTPLMATRYERNNHERSALRAGTTNALTLLEAMSAQASTQVLQYAEESRMYAMWTKSKTRQIENGIRVSSLPMRTARTAAPNELSMIAVAHLTRFHGYDRVITGMEKLRNESGQTTNLLVVGDGPELTNLRTLTTDLGLEENIQFLGQQTGPALDALFDQADIGIGALAVHRKGLLSSSTLKHREYAARGLPFIYAGIDSAFDNYPRVALQVPDDDSPVDLAAVHDWKQRNADAGVDVQSIREFARTHIDFAITAVPIIAEILDQ